MAEIPAFDPSKPYEVDAPAFDPSQSYEVLDDPQREQPKIPQAFLDRLRAGYELQQAVKKPNAMVEPEGMTTGITAAARIAKSAGGAFLHGYTASGMPMPTGGILWDAGANAIDIVGRLFRGGIEAAGSGAEQAARELGLPRPEQLGRDISAMAELEAMGGGTLGTANFSRVTPDGLQRVGALPTNRDFTDAATVLTGQPEGFTAFHGSPGEFSRFEEGDVTTDRQMAERYRQPRGQPSRGAGNLYQVQVGAPQDAFLNLDKPLSEQSEHVKTALGRVGVTIDDRLGMDAWDALRDAGDATTASETLRSAGIAGTSRALGTYSVFDKGLVEIIHRNGNSIAEENLRDLWDQRGIHPAEAVHDAQTDAFLKRDLTTPNPDPTDHSQIISPRGSPIAEGTPRTEIAKTGEHHIDSVLDSAVTNRNIDNPVIVDNYDVPYGAGGSEPLEDPHVFIDRRFPRSMEVSGVTFDPADPFTIHENIEQHVMELLTKEPPVQKGYTRFYRGEKTGGQAFNPNLAVEPGRWFTTDKKMAKGYGDKLYYVDLSREEMLGIAQDANHPSEPSFILDKALADRKQLLGTMDDAAAYKVAHHEWAEKAEGAWYRAHGIDQAEAERAYQPYLNQIEHENPRNPPPNLYEKPYPHQDVRSAEAGPVPEPTKEEIARAKDIVAQALERGESGLPQGATDIPGGHRIPITNEEGKEIGRIDIELRSPTGRREAIQVIGSQINEAERGKGYGIDAYQKLADFALSQGKELWSDRTVEPEAQRVYEGLRRRGYTVAEQDPNAIPYDAQYKVTAGPEGAPTQAGADITRPENLPTLDQQPPPPAGSLRARAGEAIDKLFGLVRNAEFLLDPMATGSNRAMVIAKDAANAVRRIDWEWTRLDQEITRRFTPEQQKRMWDAGDEESVALQLGEDRTHQGWATLEPEERRFVEYVDGLAQRAWLNAVDAGLVEGDGLPAYMPRMLLNVATAEGKSPRALNELGRNVFTRTAQMMKREHMMAEETEEAMRAKFGDEAGIARNIRALPLAIAKMEKAAIWKGMIDQIEQIGKATGTDTVANFKPGEGWFTIAGHPAFTKWKPDLEQNPIDGKWMARTDDAGNTIFRPTPIWIAPEFKGPLRSMLDEPSDKFKVVPGAPSVYSALMTLKGKAMTAILNSPLIHNEVVWGKVMEAAGGREWLGFNLYFRGNRIVNNPARAGELIDRGLMPIGPRGSFQDITSMMEQPNMQPGRSWTAQLLAAVPDLFDPAAGDAVRRAIDRAGDFWHNTLLWDRVRDVQFGLADHLSDKLVNQGVNRVAADRIAAHFSNIIVGSIPKEAMSAGAQATANLFLFSRSFTLGNLSTFKQAFTGLPKPIKAQLERDFGLVEGPEGIPTVTPEAETAFNSAKGFARRKAITTIAASAGLYYVGNALFQHAFNIASGDSSLEDEIQGYARRYRDFAADVRKDPFELRHALSRLSPTYDNEPGKSDRVHIGYDQDGTGIYVRLPFGKFGEEMTGYPTMPLDMIKRKLSPLAATTWELFDNDKGFGRKIYDDTDKTALGDVKNAFAIAKYMVTRELPEQQIMAASDLLRGEGDKTVNSLRVFGPMAGFTASVGAPGGPAKGEQLSAKQSFETRFNLAWPDIKKQIKRGDLAGASQAMMDLGVPMRMQKGLIRSAMMPGNLSGRTLQDFFQYATPEQQNRMLNAR